MLSKLKTRRFLRNESVARAAEYTLMLLLLACGLVAVIRYVGENTNTASSNVANSTGDENFRTMSPYVPGGRFGAVHY